MSPITISSNMLLKHLAQLTVAWFNHSDMPPQRVEMYNEYAERVWTSARRAGDEIWLLLGLHFILKEKNCRASDFTNERFAYTETMAREILNYLISKNPKKISALNDHIQFKSMSNKEWEKFRDSIKSKEN